jgi:hypothetical protein
MDALKIEKAIVAGSAAYARKFLGIFEHRTVSGGIGPTCRKKRPKSLRKLWSTSIGSERWPSALA